MTQSYLRITLLECTSHDGLTIATQRTARAPVDVTNDCFDASVQFGLSDSNGPQVDIPRQSIFKIRCPRDRFNRFPGKRSLGIELHPSLLPHSRRSKRPALGDVISASGCSCTLCTRTGWSKPFSACSPRSSKSRGRRSGVAPRTVSVMQIPPWVGQLFDALSQHDARTRHRAICNHHLAKTDPNSNLRADIVPDSAVVTGVLSLERQGCADCIRRTSELCNKRIVPYLVGNAVVSVDGRREALESILHPFMGNTFVSLNKRR